MLEVELMVLMNQIVVLPSWKRDLKFKINNELANASLRWSGREEQHDFGLLILVTKSIMDQQLNS